MNQCKQLLVEIQATHNLLLKQKDEAFYHQKNVELFLQKYRYTLTLTSLTFLLFSKKIIRKIPSFINKSWELGLLMSKLL